MSKGKKLVYKKLSTQKYLKPRCILNAKDMKEISNQTCRNTDVKQIIRTYNQKLNMDLKLQKQRN